ncbi:MAG: CRISPR-associated helicase Cas3', partial [Eubacteriales bacterium]
MEISKEAWRIWAKKQGDPPMWMPLAIHIADCIDVAERLWENWLSDGVRLKLAQSLGSFETAKQLLVFFAAVHDLGKVTVIFQSKPSYPTPYPIDYDLIEKLFLAGLDMPDYSGQTDPQKTPHAMAGEIMLLTRECPKSVAVVVGSHHGKPSDFEYTAEDYLYAYRQHYIGGKEHNHAWLSVQNEFMEFILSNSGFGEFSDIPEIPQEVQIIYSGLLIMVDWIASNSYYYPLFSLEDDLENTDLEARHQDAWIRLNLPYGYRQQYFGDESTLCKERFGFEPNELQNKVLEIAQSMSGGIMVIEAPMGIGKTEAALLAAEVFMAQNGRTGVFFALPTQATSDGIFTRFENWMKKLDDDQHSFQLSHGKAQFNEKYMALERLGGSKGIAIDEFESSYGENSGAVVHTWFEGRKKSLLADFVVGTVDQLLMVALKQKHVMLRHLGVSNKVVIIDECHAYDAYMSHYLHRALHWLGAYQVPVIVLSATLPVEKRKWLVAQYLGVSKKKARQLQEEWTVSEDYPLITYTRDNHVFQDALGRDREDEKLVSIDPIDEDALEELLLEWRKNGACVGIIVNTVKRAQRLAERLSEEFSDSVELLHSAFLSSSRTVKEQNLLTELGKEGKRPHFKIVVGTQVLEQSLDIDFDVMITDLCPMDLLLQRIGRLQRHKRSRPPGMESADCYVMNLKELESGAVAVYGEFLLERTRSILPNVVSLPADIAPLVQRVYAVDEDLPLEPLGYKKMKADFLRSIADKENKASAFRLANVQRDETIHKLLKNSTNVDGEAKVRDAEQSFEILMVQKMHNGMTIIGEKESI